jgi:hypothetical protein
MTILVLAIILFIILFVILKWHLFKTDIVFHIVIIPYDVTLKPSIPHKFYQDYMIVINQSAFTYNLDERKNEYEFKITNQNLNREELKEISKQVIHNNVETKYYIF